MEGLSPNGDCPVSFAPYRNDCPVGVVLVRS